MLSNMKWACARTSFNCAVLLLLTQLSNFAQSPPAFEVASVKPYNGPRTRLLDFSSSGPRVRLLAYTIGGLIREAYNLQGYQLAFGLSVRREEAYDPYYYSVEAKAPGDGPRTRAEFRRMLQTLLSERFNVKVHRETNSSRAQQKPSGLAAMV
jgi:uncharacterized protein (TIGR03435 family)